MSGPGPSPRQRLGRAGEDLAAQAYEADGFRVVARNWRPSGVGLRGELDLVVEREGLVVFCEVKTRTSARFGGGAEAITHDRRRRLRALAAAWWREYGDDVGPRRIRIDVVVVSVDPGGPPVLERIEGID